MSVLAVQYALHVCHHIHPYSSLSNQNVTGLADGGWMGWRVYERRVIQIWNYVMLICWV